MKTEQIHPNPTGSEQKKKPAFPLEWFEAVPALGSIAWLAPRLTTVAEQVLFGAPKREEEVC